MEKKIDTKEALDRLRSYPPRMLGVDDAYYILFGVKASKTARERILESLRLVYTWVTAPFYAVYYRCSNLLMSSADEDQVVSAEDGPPGSKPGDVLFPAEGIELFLRRNRKIIFHPSLGIEITTLELPIEDEDRYRIAPADLARYLRGEPPLEYETGSLNLLNSNRIDAEVPPETE